MRHNNVKTITFIILVALLLFSNNIFSLSGNSIIDSANKYKIHPWDCNEINARSANSNGIWDKSRLDGGKDWRYPFFPVGEPTGPDPDGDGPLAAPTATGNHTGVPYALGLRDNVDLFEYKLKSGPVAVPTKEPILAGEIDRVFSSKYTGLDCSGFITNCLAFPDLRKNNSYTLWHPGTIHLKNDEYYLTDSITWEELCPGDILVKYEAISNNGNISIHQHAALAAGSGASGNTIKTYESAPRFRNQGTQTLEYRTKVDESEYVRKNDGKIYRCDGGTEYEPRRFSPPYVKKVSVYREKIVKGIVEDYDLVYSREWRKKDDSNDIELKPNISSDAVYSGKLFFVIDFTKAMAVKVTSDNYSSPWENITVKLGKKGREIALVNQGSPLLIKKCNNSKSFFRGWGNGIDIDNGTIHTRWMGEITVKDDDKEFFIENTLYIDATSLSQSLS